MECIYIYSIYYTTQLYRDYKKPIQGSPLKNQDFPWISHWVGFDHCSYGFNWFWPVGADFADHVWVPKKSCLVMSRFTPWKFNSSPLKISHPKRKVIFKPSFFRGYVKLRGCSSCCFKCFFTKQKPWPSHSLASKIIFQNNFLCHFFFVWELSFGEANVIFFGGEVPIRQWLIVGLRPGGLGFEAGTPK